MAARTRKGTKAKGWPEIVRKRIQASMLEKSLIQHVNGEREMKPSQVTAGLGLLKKVLPDLSTLEHTGADGAPLTVNIVRFSDSDNPPE